jgi:hypothetical protein
LKIPPTGNPTHPFDLYMTHRQAAQLLDELPAAGVARALVVLRGWIRGGYDWSHPDIWPPDERVGSVEELRAVCDRSGPYTVALHDNYMDSYQHNPSWPHGVIRTPQQRWMQGGYWAGGQAYIMNAEAGVRYAERNWKRLQQLKPKAMFIDTTTAVQAYQSYDPARPIHRAEDLANKIQLLKFFKQQGVVLGSEEGADFGAAHLDWCENRHVRQDGESIPLWPLVFHDALVSCRYTADVEDTWAVDGKNGYPIWLLDMLWGYAALTGPRKFEQREKAYQRMRETRQVDAWFASISTDSMDDHAFLTSDGSLERTQFSSGRSIVVNFSPEEQKHDGRTILAHGYVAYDAHGDASTL